MPSVYSKLEASRGDDGVPAMTTHGGDHRKTIDRNRSFVVLTTEPDSTDVRHLLRQLNGTMGIRTVVTGNPDLAPQGVGCEAEQTWFVFGHGGVSADGTSYVWLKGGRYPLKHPSLRAAGGRRCMRFVFTCDGARCSHNMARLQTETPEERALWESRKKATSSVPTHTMTNTLSGDCAARLQEGNPALAVVLTVMSLVPFCNLPTLTKALNDILQPEVSVAKVFTVGLSHQWNRWGGSTYPFCGDSKSLAASSMGVPPRAYLSKATTAEDRKRALAMMRVTGVVRVAGSRRPCEICDHDGCRYDPRPETTLSPVERTVVASSLIGGLPRTSV
jgi:hypothetical protein